MSDTAWRTELDVGTLSITVLRGDPVPTVNGKWSGATMVLAPLVVGWRFPDSVLWPPQPEPVVARFSLLFDTPDDVDAAGIDIGAPVHLLVYAGAYAFGTEIETVRFAGKVSEMTAVPVNGLLAGGRRAWRVDLVANDYTAALADTEVAGQIPFQGLSTYGKVAQLFLLAGLPAPAWSTGGYGGQVFVGPDQGRIDSGRLSDAVDRLLRTYADMGPFTGDESVRENHSLWQSEGFRRGVLRALLTPEGLPNSIVPYRVEWVTQRHVSPGGTDPDPTDTTTYPYAWRWNTLTAGGRWVASVPLQNPAHITDASIVLTGGVVEFPVTWTRNRDSYPSRVVVTNNLPDDSLTDWRATAAALPGAEGGVLARVEDAELVQRYNALNTAAMYLPQTPAAQDAPDRFVWRASEDPRWPILPSLFPDASAWFGHSTPVLIYSTAEGMTPAKGQTVTINGTPYTGRRDYVGTLHGVEFTMDGRGEFSYTLSLRPGAPPPGGGADEGAIVWADMGGAAPSNGRPVPTFANVHPGQASFADMRLTRRRALHPF